MVEWPCSGDCLRSELVRGMVVTVLAVGGGLFLTAILGFIVWVAAFRDEVVNLSRADETQRISWSESAARGDYIGGSGRARGDYVGTGSFW